MCGKSIFPCYTNVYNLCRLNKFYPRELDSNKSDSSAKSVIYCGCSVCDFTAPIYVGGVNGGWAERNVNICTDR